MADFERVPSFICDDKFEEVIKDMTRRGWRRHATTGMLSSDCELIWRNLASTHFQSVFGRHVNHFRGSQHLSNKAFLTYHLRATGRAHFLPATWSASFQTMTELVAMLVQGSLVALLAASFTGCSLSSSGSESGAISESMWSELENLEEVVNALDMEGNTDTSEAGQQCRELCRCLVTLVRGLSQCPCVGMDAGPAAHDAASSDLWSYLDLIVAKHGTAAISATLRHLRDIAPGLLSDSNSVGERNLWIVKPVGGSCGDSIQVVAGVRAALLTVRSMGLKCVVQKYIERPLLVREGRKFDIRQWLLVTDVNPLTVYGYRDYYLRLSACALDLSDAQLSNPAMHLCNHAVQKKQTEVNAQASVQAGPKVLDLDDTDYSCDTMMSRTEFVAWLEGVYGPHEGASVLARLESDIRELSVGAVQSAVDRLCRVGKGFEWLGLDFMVVNPTGHARDLSVKLIEVNVSPDVSLSTPVTAALVPTATRALLDIVLNTPMAEADGADCAPVSPWQMWHAGAKKAEGFQEILTRRKEGCMAFGEGYGPRQLHVLERVEALLELNVQESFREGGVEARGVGESEGEGEGETDNGGSSDDEI